jgi:hypothetical protein
LGKQQFINFCQNFNVFLAKSEKQHHFIIYQKKKDC